MREASVPANLVHYSHKGQWWHFRARTSIHFHGNKTIPESDFVQSKWLCVITWCTLEVSCHRSQTNVTILYLNKKSFVHSSIFLQTKSVLPSSHCSWGKKFNINAIMVNKWKGMQMKQVGVSLSHKQVKLFALKQQLVIYRPMFNITVSKNCIFWL